MAPRLQSFNRRLDRQLEESRHNSFLVYPEGAHVSFPIS